MASRIFSRLLPAAVAILVITCKLTDTGKKDILNIKLDDSLSLAAGKYDSLRVDLLKEDGSPLYPKVFQGPYHPSPDSMLTGIQTPPLPENFKIRIFAYKDGAPALVFIFGMEGDVSKKPEVVLRGGKPVVAVTPESLSFKAGDPGRRIWARIALDSQQLGVTWSSSRPSVASVDSQGMVTPQGRGMTQITARAKMDTSAYALVPVTVTDDSVPPKPTAVSILTPSPLTLAEGGPAYEVQAQVLPSNAPQEIFWTSRNPAIAEVNAQGRITPKTIGQTRILARPKEDTALADSLLVEVIRPRQVDSLFVTPDSMILYLGGTPGQLQVRFVPADTANKPNFLSSDMGVAKVDNSGRVTAVAIGEAIIRATPLGMTSPRDSSKIRVKRDIPQISAGPDRNANLGDSLNFSIRVTQEHGGIRLLRWDFEGDGTYDGSLTDSTRKDTTLVRGHRYRQANTFQAKFFVEDTEGNKDSVTVRVVIGSRAPFVDIVKPSKDTTLATRNFTLEYLVDSVRKTQALQLQEGFNKVVVAETSQVSGLVGKDSVVIWVDTEPPRVKITSPANGFVTRLGTVQVDWTVDSIVQQTRRTEDLGGKHGLIAIVRDATDSVGNRGQDTVRIKRDTVAPAFQMQDYSSGQLITLTDTNVVDLRGTISDSGSGVKSLGYAISGKTVKAFTAMTRGASWNLNGIRLNNQGESVITFTYEDSAGNSGTANLRVNVAVPLPTVEFLPPTPPDSTVSTKPTFTIKWRINGREEFLDGITLSENETRTVVKTAWNKAGDTLKDSVTITRVPSYIRFVKATATGNSDGTSWLDAYRNLNGAVSNPYPTGQIQVWVAKGTYYPDTANAGLIFEQGIKIFGGFEGKEKSISERAPNTRSLFNGLQQSRFAIVRDSTLIDGFEITNSISTVLDYNSPGSGGDTTTVRNSTVQNCVFRQNGNQSSSFWDATITAGKGDFPASWKIINCTFADNSMRAVRVTAKAWFKDCNFQSNVVGSDPSDPYPDIHVISDTTTLERCTFDPAKSGPPENITIIP